MLILSKHHDYYDGVAHAGIDKTIVYKRLIRTFMRKQAPLACSLPDSLIFEEVEKDSDGFRYIAIPGGATMDIPVKTLKYKSSWSYDEYDRVHSKGIIFFCGKPYPYCKARVFKGMEKDCTGWLTRKYVDEYFYDNESASKAVYAALKDKLEFGTSRSNWEKERLKKQVEKYDFSKGVLPALDDYSKDKVLDLHRKLNSPIIHLSEILETNINLKELGFHRTVDPYSAFQEISMFISGVLGNPEKDTLSITDKDRIQQHGFDKWSFRKLPEGK